MPRETLDITRFNTGIVALPDAKDLPVDAEAWSTNVDVDRYPGRVRGRLQEYDLETNSIGLSATAVEEIRLSSGLYTGIFYKPGSGLLTGVADLHKTSGHTEATIATFGTGETLAMQRHNNVLHIGRGTGADAKWVGVLEHGQFGSAVPSTISSHDAKLERPDTIPLLYKTFYYTTGGVDYIYGISWKGTRLYRVNLSTGAVSYSSELLKSTQGLCDSSGVYCYLFDYTGGNGLGTLYKMDKTTLGIVEQYEMTKVGTYLPAGIYYDGSNIGGEISDIEETTNYVVFSAWRAPVYTGVHTLTTPSATQGNNFLSCVAKSSLTTGGTFVTASVSLNGVAGGTQGDIRSNVEFGLYKRNLFHGSTAGEVGYVVDFGTNVDKTAGAPTAVGYAIIFINETALAAGVAITNVAGANARLRVLTTSGLTQNPPSIAYVIEGVDTSNDACIIMDTYDNYESNLAGKDPFTVILGLTTGSFTIAGSAWDGTGWDTSTFTIDVAKDHRVVNSSICSIGGGTFTIMSADSPPDDPGAPLFEDDWYSWGSTGKLYTLDFDVSSFANQSYVDISGVVVLLSTSLYPVSTFAASQKAFYRVSFTYDDYQESPLSDIFFDMPTVASSAFKVGLRLVESAMSDRVTAVNLYRSDGASTLANPDAYYRFVTSISVKGSWSTDNVDAGTWGTFRSFTFFDVGAIKASYEVNTGLPEDILEASLNYQYSTQLTGYHFVGNVSNLTLGTVERMVVRSKSNAFDMFDFTRDLLLMPKRITAMCGFAGNVYVFSDNEIYRVNPQSMFIEDTIIGYGVPHQYAVTAVEGVGMFFADANGFYRYDGKQVIPIGDAVKSAVPSFTKPWRTYAGTFTIRVVPFMKQQSILFLQGDPSAGTPIATRIYVYHLPDGIVRYWEVTAPSASSVFGVFMDHKGQPWLSTNAKLTRIACGANPVTAWDWYSKEFDFGMADQLKMLDAVDSVGTNVAGVTVSYNGGSSFASFVAHVYQKAVMVKVAVSGDTGYTSDLQAIEIIFRRLVGRR